MKGTKMTKNRFNFNAIVSSYYDIDTPEDYKEYEPQIYLEDVVVFEGGSEIGISWDKVNEAVKKQYPSLAEPEVGQIMQHFEDNSNSSDEDWLTIRPDEILQCTGLKDSNDELIYEGDTVRYCRYPDDEDPEWEEAEVVWGMDDFESSFYPAFELKGIDFNGMNGFSYLFCESYIVEVVCHKKCKNIEHV